jgi:hypothetical protein
MEVGMSDGPVFDGWQHCREGTRHMLIVNVV